MNVIALRKAKGMKPGDLAEKVGVHLNIIKKIEAGHSTGSETTKKALAKVLGVTISDLYNEKGNVLTIYQHKTFEEYIKQGLERWESMSESRKNLLRAIYFDDPSLAEDPVQLKLVAEFRVLEFRKK